MKNPRLVSSLPSDCVAIEEDSLRLVSVDEADELSDQNQARFPRSHPFSTSRFRCELVRLRYLSIRAPARWSEERFGQQRQIGRSQNLPQCCIRTGLFVL